MAKEKLEEALSASLLSRCYGSGAPGRKFFEDIAAGFDTLVARYYCSIYNFALRMTDDPLEAVLLPHDAFARIRKKLWSGRDEVAVVTIVLNAVIRAGLTAA